jgi:carboxyl-terminal processing protease
LSIFRTRGDIAMSTSSKIISVALLVIVIALSFAGGFYFGQTQKPVAIGNEVFNEAWNDIFAKYVDPSQLDAANMTRSAIQGMLKAVDDRYMTYFTSSQLNQFISSLEGKYAGIGAMVSTQEKKIIIVYIFTGSPAEKAGLKAGDVITGINGESTADYTLDMATSKIRGDAGTSVTLQILHAGAAEPVSIEITRAIVDVPSVTYEQRGDIAIVTVFQFTERTEDEMVVILKKIREAGAKGIVLDLRGNPGGYLDVVIKVTSNFIPNGIIVKVQSNEGVIETHGAVAVNETTDLPMVVLVNEYSASGAEVLTGALQDYDRAVVGGNTTYGKGSVTLPVQLSDGSGLYITIARWLTPKDRLIEGQGIVPDVKLDITGDAALQWAIDYLSAKN